jgi:putative restriction endonuclease
MAFGVFIHRADSMYKDSPATQYQFSKLYLSRASAFIGDWVIYYEPVKVPRSRGYYAMAQVAAVVPDPADAKMYLAVIEPLSFMQFPTPVPFALEDGLAETGLLNDDGELSGRKQAAVRPISPKDFNRILSRGFREEHPLLPRIGAPVGDQPTGFQIDEEQSEFVYEQERERVATLTSRVVRDRVFRRVVLQAYSERCAVTGLKLINGGGRAEVAAAHIRPVEHNGPDSINNGLALSGTAHWMFDRGLIGISDDLEIVVSRHVNDRDGAASLINKTGRLIGPVSKRDRPHPAFLQWHRENCFKH